MKRSEKGFTLMELMVVIVIVAILAAVAVPIYINYVNDAKRTEAKGAIGALATAEQTYYQKNSIYTTDLASLNVDLGATSVNWTVTVTAADVNGFTVQAVGKAAANGLTETGTFTKAAGMVIADS